MAKKRNSDQELTEGPKPFSRTIAMLEDGQLDHDLGEEVTNIVASLRDHVEEHSGSAKGKLAITLDFKLDRKVFEVAVDFKSSLPKTKRQRSVVWATDGNNLAPENPNQERLPFGMPRAVAPAPEAAPRRVEEAPASPRRVEEGAEIRRV